MNWITVCWSAAIAACATLAWIHAQIALRLRGRARVPHAFFTLVAVAVGVTGSIELSLLHVTDLAAYRRLMYWAEVPICVMMASLAGFAQAFLRARSRLTRPVAWLTVALLLAHLAAPTEISIRHAEEIRRVVFAGGVTITVPRIGLGGLEYAEIAVVALLVAQVALAARQAWRRGERQRAALVGGGIIFFQVVSRLYAMQVEAGRLHTPYFFIFPFLGLLLAMGRELSLDVIRAARLTEDLAESERRMDLAARAARLSFWAWDAQRDLIWATPEARRMFGLTGEGPIDFARFLSILDPADRDPVRKAAHAALRDGGEYEMEYRILPEGGPPRWIVARGRADASPGAPAGLMRGVVMDVTERKAALMEAEIARKELLHLARVSTLGELAASLAHELNQPLAAILSNAQAARRFLAAQPPELDDVREGLDDIIAADKRAGEVIHRLRQLAQKQGQPQREPLSVNDLVREVERLLRGEFIARGVVLAVELAPDLPAVHAGRVELQQVLLNLLINALDALRAAGRTDGMVRMRTLPAGDAVRVEVRDNGPGVPADLRERIFLPFFSTKPNGLGIGLSICRTILESAGGRLLLEDNPPAGACFALELPATAAT